MDVLNCCSVKGFALGVRNTEESTIPALKLLIVYCLDKHNQIVYTTWEGPGYYAQDISGTQRRAPESKAS